LRLTRVLPPERLDAPTLAAEVGRLVDWRPAPFDLDLNGAAATAQAVADLDHRRQAGGLRRRPARDWLEPLRSVLKTATEPVTFFFRDDDAGWADDRLLVLLDAFARQGVPIALSVIPRALHARFARRLLDRAQAGTIGFL